MEKLVILHSSRIDAQTENITPTLTEQGWCVMLPKSSDEMVSQLLEYIPTNLLQHIRHGIFTAPGTSEAKQQIHEDIWRGRNRSKPSAALKSLGTADLSKLIEHTGMELDIFNVIAACSSGIKSLQVLQYILQTSNDLAVIISFERSSIHHYRHIFGSVGALSKDATWIPPLVPNTSPGGIMLGDGAAIMVVSTKSTAERLGFTSQAIIDSIGFATIPTHFTKPSSFDAVQKLIVDTIHKSGKSYNDFVLWDAHATGTKVGDEAELALQQAILPSVPIYSHKAIAGHTLSASSLVETVAALQRLSGESQQTFLKCSFGFGGQNGVAVITTT